MERLSIDNILDEIDAELVRPPYTVQEALIKAVEAGRMDIKEANQCLDAYMRTYTLDPNLPPAA